MKTSQRVKNLSVLNPSVILTSRTGKLILGEGTTLYVVFTLSEPLDVIGLYESVTG